MTARISSTQFRVALWVVRNTVGWNRRLTRYSWYRVARELELDRAGVWRAGHALLAAGVLYVEHGRLAVEDDPQHWRIPTTGRLALAGVNVDGRQRKALTVNNAAVDPKQRAGCPESTDFRRGKDSRKDNSKTYKRTWRSGGRRSDVFSIAANRVRKRREAKRYGGKYDSLSEN